MRVLSSVEVNEVAGAGLLDWLKETAEAVRKWWQDFIGDPANGCKALELIPYGGATDCSNLTCLMQWDLYFRNKAIADILGDPAPKPPECGPDPRGRSGT